MIPIPSFMQAFIRLTDDEVDRIARRVVELILSEVLEGMQAKDLKDHPPEGGG